MTEMPKDMIDSSVVEGLVRVLGTDCVSTQPEDLDRYSADALTPTRAFAAAPRMERMADVVVMPRTVEQIAEVVKVASRTGTPIVPYGGGTGVMGGVLPVRGGIVVDLKGLNRVLEVTPRDGTVLTEAGVVLEDLSAALEQQGLMLGHDPWSVPIATVGGAISTNGVGYMASSFGPMGEQVLGLEVVLPSGEVLSTRGVPKYSSGPNLNHLFIGSEGAFGIITKATLKVPRLPEKRSYATVAFDTFEKGFDAVAELFSLGVRPALVDLTEEASSGQETRILLYMMYQGYKEGVSAQRRRSLQVCISHGGSDLGASETLDYWEQRHRSGESYRDMIGQPRKVRWERWRRGFDYLHMALPVSKVLEYRRRCEEILAGRGVKVVEYAVWTQPELFSMLIVPDEADTPVPGDDMAAIVDQVLGLAQDLGGTMEYCHGVGLKLAHLLPREMGVGYDVARAIKRALDPQNIMNPGKLF